MVDLAHTLGLEVVAEGVEDEPTMRLLAAFACDRAQGYYMARPMPAVLLDQYLKEHGLPGWGDALAA
jgi:EAL domain-containing protein (putative c-di-GMP-specific phosphodiesterase class I)